MEFTGHYALPAPPETVWAALNDPAVLQACIAGCESLTKTGDNRFEATARLKIGPVSARFRAVIERGELDPPRRCVLKGEGQGGVAGFARGEAEVLLTNEAGGTVLSYVAKASIGGKLAQVGQRLLDGAARQIADDFFARFAAQIGALPVEPVAAEPTPPPTAPPEAAPSASREGIAPEIWIIGLIGVIVILLVLFGVAL